MKPARWTLIAALLSPANITPDGRILWARCTGKADLRSAASGRPEERVKNRSKAGV